MLEEDATPASRREQLLARTALAHSANLNATGALWSVEGSNAGGGSGSSSSTAQQVMPAAWQAVATWLPALPAFPPAATLAPLPAVALTSQQQAKLKALVRQHCGAPQQLRPSLWLLASGGLALSRQPGAPTYWDLVHLATSPAHHGTSSDDTAPLHTRAYSSKGTPSPGSCSDDDRDGCSGLAPKGAAPVPGGQGLAAAAAVVSPRVLAQVDVDARTVGLAWRHHALFKTLEGQACVARVTLALLALLGPGGSGDGHAGLPCSGRGLGYARTLTHAVAFTLVVFGGVAHEQACFWTLAALLRTRLFGHCGGQWHLGARVEQEVLRRLVSRKLPRLAAHLAALDLPLAALTQGWLASLFVSQLPPETLARVWDALVVEGAKVPLRVALALLKAHEATLVSCATPELLCKVLEVKVARHAPAHQPQALLAAAFSRALGSLPGSALDAMRIDALRRQQQEEKEDGLRSDTGGGHATASAAASFPRTAFPTPSAASMATSSGSSGVGGVGGVGSVGGVAGARASAPSKPAGTGLAAALAVASLLSLARDSPGHLSTAGTSSGAGGAGMAAAAHASPAYTGSGSGSGAGGLWAAALRNLKRRSSSVNNLIVATLHTNAVPAPVAPPHHALGASSN